MVQKEQRSWDTPSLHFSAAAQCPCLLTSTEQELSICMQLCRISAGCLLELPLEQHQMWQHQWAHIWRAAAS